MGPTNAVKLKHVAGFSVVYLLTALSLIFSLENFKERNNLIWPGIRPVQPHIQSVNSSSSLYSKGNGVLKFLRNQNGELKIFYKIERSL